jgi:hypothetical protein
VILKGVYNVSSLSESSFIVYFKPQKYKNG